MVGEVRDPVTAETAVRAANSGHLVLATLHAPVAAGASSRACSAWGSTRTSWPMPLLGVCSAAGADPVPRVQDLRSRRHAATFDEVRPWMEAGQARTRSCARPSTQTSAPTGAPGRGPPTSSRRVVPRRKGSQPRSPRRSPSSTPSASSCCAGWLPARSSEVPRLPPLRRCHVRWPNLHRRRHGQKRCSSSSARWSTSHGRRRSGATSAMGLIRDPRLLGATARWLALALTLAGDSDRAVEVIESAVGVIEPDDHDWHSCSRPSCSPAGRGQRRAAGAGGDAIGALRRPARRQASAW